VGDRDHEVTTAHPGQLGERDGGIIEVLEHLQAKDEVERSVSKRELVDTLA
jgi:hypothetical protein